MPPLNNYVQQGDIFINAAPDAPIPPPPPNTTYDGTEASVGYVRGYPGILQPVSLSGSINFALAEYWPSAQSPDLVIGAYDVQGMHFIANDSRDGGTGLLSGPGVHDPIGTMGAPFSGYFFRMGDQIQWDDSLVIPAGRWKLSLMTNPDITFQTSFWDNKANGSVTWYAVLADATVHALATITTPPGNQVGGIQCPTPVVIVNYTQPFHLRAIFTDTLLPAKNQWAHYLDEDPQAGWQDIPEDTIVSPGGFPPASMDWTPFYLDGRYKLIIDTAGGNPAFQVIETFTYLAAQILSNAPTVTPP